MPAAASVTNRRFRFHSLPRSERSVLHLLNDVLAHGVVVPASSLSALTEADSALANWWYSNRIEPEELRIAVVHMLKCVQSQLCATPIKAVCSAWQAILPAAKRAR